MAEQFNVGIVIWYTNLWGSIGLDEPAWLVLSYDFYGFSIGIAGRTNCSKEEMYLNFNAAEVKFIRLSYCAT